jgi:hypothetical protein
MKKWIAINLLLLATASLLGWQLRKSIFQFRTENNLAKIQPASDLKQMMLQEKPLPMSLTAKVYNPAEFSVIPEKNLFSETRVKEDKVENSAPPEPPPLAQKPILTGITITDTERKASIIDPTAAADQRNRRGMIRKIGDVYQGYTITEIAADRIVLESGTRKEVIPLREGSKHSQGGKTAILSTRVVSFGGGGTTGGTPVNAASGGMMAPPAGTSTRTSVTAIGSQTQTVTVQPGATVQSAAPASGRGMPPAGQGQQAQPGNAPATRVIRTPFGDIVRPVQ